MSDRAAFLSYIAEHPDADLPRLVFADYLDEQGDPLYEDIGPTPRYLDLTRRHLHRFKAQLGS